MWTMVEGLQAIALRMFELRRRYISRQRWFAPQTEVR
jgi:hypothetical protein